MKQTFIVAGIGTEVGKTVASAILVEALQADYWKPVQSGSTTDSDKESVRSLISNDKSHIHEEGYLLEEPLSPHAAAKIDGIEITTENLNLPDTDNHLIVELAGGLMVPLNDTELNIDLLKKWSCPIILVANFYLGSINHTLMSIEILERNNLEIHSILFNGDIVQSSREAIENFSDKRKYLTVPRLESLTQVNIKSHAERLAKEI
ncbi:MAG: dethiobiotin synthetase [Litorivivens sp.]|jgi:dethiobiotin synthetase